MASKTSPLTVLVCPDSYKECTDAFLAAQIMAEAAAGSPSRPVPTKWSEATYLQVPLADGGEGSLDAILGADSRFVEVDITVPNAIGEPTEATIGWNEEESSAFIESAQALGLGLIPPEERDVLQTDSFGLGMMITEALNMGAKEITLALGGSGTNDGGAGMLSALGARLYDRQGREIPPFPGGVANLAAVDLRNMDPRLEETTFRLALDVDNPLLGPNGASAVFGPQKGASPRDVAILETTLRKLARAVTASQKFAAKSRGDAAASGSGSGSRSGSGSGEGASAATTAPAGSGSGEGASAATTAPATAAAAIRNLADVPGSGAAGGIGWAAMQVLNAEPNPGFDLIAEAVRLDHAIARANVVFTGEGRLDGQTMSGKTVRRVVERASKSDVPVVIFAGSLGPGWENIKALGNVEVIVTTPDGTETAEALENCEENLRSAVWNYVSRS